MLKSFLHVIILNLAVLAGSFGADQIQFDHIIELPDNPVFCITQDKKGFMWFGTKNGLLKFDGHELTTFNSSDDDSTSLTNDWIWSIYCDTRSELWIGSADGLNLWIDKENRFQRIVLPSSENGKNKPVTIRKIYEDKQGNLWIGTNHGLYIKSYDNPDFHKCDLSYGLSQLTDYDIKEIFEGSNNHLYVATQFGISSIVNRKLSYQTIPANLVLKIDNQIEDTRSVYSDAINDVFWIGTQSEMTGLIKSQNRSGKNEIITLKGSVEINSIRIIRNFGDNTLWLGTMNGLIQLDTLTNTTEKHLNHLSIRDIYQDIEKGLWAATYNDGIYYYSPNSNRFEHIYEYAKPFSTQEQNRSEVVTDVVQSKDNQIWIGTEYGLKVYRPDHKNFPIHLNRTMQTAIVNDRVKCLEYTNDNMLWVGTFNGISCLDLTNGNIKNYVPTSNPKNQGWNEIHDLIKIKEEVWIGTNGGGVFCLDRDFRFTQHADHFIRGANYVNAMHSFTDSIIWIGSNAGLSAIKPDGREFKKFGSSNYMFPEVNVISITHDNKNNLWLGTERSGLIYFDPQSFDFLRINKENGLPDNNIKSVQIDVSQNLWVTTQQGLLNISLSPKEDLQSTSFEVYDFSINTDFGKPLFLSNSTTKTSSGEILFGTHHGITYFDPSQISSSRKYPKVWIRDISINQQKITINKDLSLKYGNTEELLVLSLEHYESVLSFYFTGINYSNQDELYYAYNIDGINDRWEIINKQRQLSFNYLPPGKYTLRLKSSNSKQNWGSDYTALDLIINPPFYKSLIAFLIYGVTILALLYIFFYYSSNWQKMKNRLVIEELNKNKEYELHQLKSEFFINISHELKAPLTLILAPVEDLLAQKIENTGVRNRLKMVKRNAERILKLVNQIVDVRKIETSRESLNVAKYDIIAFIHEVSSVFNELSRIKNIEFNISSSSENIDLWFDRNKLETAISNLLSNAFKYTKENGKIEVSIVTQKRSKGLDEDDQVNIIIEDNGKGIAQEDIPHLFDRFYHISNRNKRLSIGDGIGLDLAKKCIEIQKGSIKIESLQENERTSGLTRITISLKRGNQHFDDNDVTNEPLHHSSTKDPDLNDYALINLIDAKASDSNIDDYSILIVDINSESIQQIRDIFSNCNHIYDTSDGLEAWKLTLDIIPDIVISSESAGTIDGEELCHRIKIDERTCHIPVILLSEQNQFNNQAEFVPDEFIAKPINADFLKQRVEYFIDQRNRIRRQFEKKSILKPNQITSYDEKMLDSVINYIEDHLSDPNLSVERMSKEIGISRVHFYRKIKSVMNMSPNEFIRSYRIRKAGQLLEQKKLNDADYFRSCFKKEFGVNPSDFMKD
jgi:signal transduction histidine kinase/ligand-binding sensor domain-containing protein/AraC-like DNA-binding protein/CheY-like chemotaxis protein